MNIQQAFESVFKAARRAPLDGDSHDLVMKALKMIASYITENEKQNNQEAATLEEKAGE